MVTLADRRARRNAAVAAASGVAVAVLFFFPTSTNHLGTQPGQAAASAIVAQPAADVPVAATDPTSGASTTASSTASTKRTTVDGAAADTRFGPVQVRLTLQNGKVISAAAIDYPQSNRRDVQINAYAVPVLNGEAVDAQSANIDTVSGATFTSMGYKQSLQAALDAAHLT